MANHQVFSSFADHNAQVKRKILKSLKARADAKRTWAEKLADWTTYSFGSMTFLIGNLVLFLVWILINTEVLKIMPVFDPFPFNFLTMLVSLQAIILAIFVLISQNRSVRIDDLRQETDLQINLITERELTKLMKMIYLSLEKQGVNFSDDPELQEMLKPTNEEDIERNIEQEFLP